MTTMNIQSTDSNNVSSDWATTEQLQAMGPTFYDGHQIAVCANESTWSFIATNVWFRTSGVTRADVEHMDIRSKIEKITVINDDQLPERFQYAAMYRWPQTDDEVEANVGAFRAYCAENSIFYYARSREHFFRYEAFELCAKANCTKLLMEDLS
jgi:hypothetical protein